MKSSVRQVTAKKLSRKLDQLKDQDRDNQSCRIKVSSRGEIIIDSTYIEGMRLLPGDEFEVHLGYKHIYLKRVELNDHAGSRMTLQEMYKKYPDQWLIVADSKYQINGEIISGIVLFATKNQAEIDEKIQSIKAHSLAIEYTGSLIEDKSFCKGFIL